MKKTLISSFVILLTIGVSAQTIKKYKGQMSKPEWISELFEVEEPNDINGFYSYYDDERENRIIHGNFMISYKTGALNFVDKYEINGSFSHGKRVGKWVMKAKLFNKKYAKNYLYQFSYRDGLLSGPFYYYSPETEEVEITGQFKNGVISGNVIIKQHCWIGKCYTQLEGPVNDKGNPHGVWTEKDVSEKAIPKDITRLYYDGNLVYRREKDLSSGKIEYTYSVSNEIRVPADTAKISDTIIKGKGYIKVGTIICVKDTNLDFYDIKDRFDDDRTNEDGCVLYGVILKKCPMMGKIYPSISNWHTRLDSHSYAAMIKREQEEEQRRKEEQIREEQRLKEEAERRQREEELRKRREEEAQLNAEIEAAWNEGQAYYRFCWSNVDARSKFERLFKRIGLDSIEARLDSISQYEYENYTVKELFEKYDRNFFDSDRVLGKRVKSKKSKKLYKIFNTYEAYLRCKRGGLFSLIDEIEKY